MPRGRRRIDDVAHVRGEVADRLNVVANLAFKNDPPLGRADVEVPFVVRIVGRKILLVAPDGLRPHMIVLHDVLPVEFRIFLGFVQIEVGLVVADVGGRSGRDVEADFHHRETGWLLRFRSLSWVESLVILLVRIHPQRGRVADHFNRVRHFLRNVDDGRGRRDEGRRLAFEREAQLPFDDGEKLARVGMHPRCNLVAWRALVVLRVVILVVDDDFHPVGFTFVPRLQIGQLDVRFVGAVLARLRFRRPP